MSTKTNIEWATSTGNPWIGCTKVSPGCKNCYAAELDANRFSKTMGGGTKENPESHWGKGAPRVRTKAFWKDALKWQRQQEDFGDGSQRPRIFPSLCDWLDDEVPIEWLADFLKLIHDTPNLDWLLLSKRPENWKSRLEDAWDILNEPKSTPSSVWLGQWLDNDPVPPNIWLGVSVEDQKRADERIPLLLNIPAKVRFLSVEPLLEKVDLDFWYDAVEEEYGPYPGNHNPTNELHWVIVGGESGSGRRDCGVEAICDVARQCVAAGVPCFVKQDAAFKPGQKGRIPDDVWALKQLPTLSPPAQAFNPDDK